MRRRQNPLIVVVLGLLAGPALMASAAALAGQLGRSSAAWDVLNHFAPIWLAGALLGVLVGLFLHGVGRIVVCAVCLAGTVAAASTMAPEYLRYTAPAQDSNGVLKIIQFNAWIENPHADRVLAFLRREDPDIVVLEEVSPVLRAALAGQSTWRVSCGGCEVVILTKRRPTAVARIGTAARVDLHDQAGAFTVIGAHNAWPIEDDQPVQEARLAGLLAEQPRARSILAGDFNSTPWSFERRRWDRAFGLIRRDRGLFSWPTGRVSSAGPTPPFAVLPIDHVYAGVEWATVEVRRGPKGLGSDHFPVIVSLAPVSRP